MRAGAGTGTAAPLGLKLPDGGVRGGSTDPTCDGELWGFAGLAGDVKWWPLKSRPLSAGQKCSIVPVGQFGSQSSSKAPEGKVAGKAVEKWGKWDRGNWEFCPKWSHFSPIFPPISYEFHTFFLHLPLGFFGTFSHFPIYPLSPPFSPISPPFPPISPISPHFSISPIFPIFPIFPNLCG